MALKAAIYTRVSSERQAADDRVSLGIQLEECRSLAAKLGYEVIVELRDVETGTSRRRKAYQQLVKLITDHQIDAVIAWAEDRLYRGFGCLPLYEAVADLPGFRVDLVNGSWDRSMMAIMAGIAQKELDDIRRRTVSARKARLASGRFGGGSPRYGYRKDRDGFLAINDREAEVVRQIFAWYLEGYHLLEIRRMLDERGTRPRKSKRWSKGTLMGLLYEGEAYATERYPVSLDGETFELACPPILDMATWKRSCELRQEHRAWPSRNVKEDYLCRGLVTCPCGWTWGARTVRRKGGVMTNAGYYACPRPGHAPEAVHPDCPKTIGSGKLDDFVWRSVKGILQHPEILHEAIDEKVAELSANREDIEGGIEALERRLGEMDEERQWIIRRARKRIITEADMQFQLGELDLSRLQTYRELARLQAQQTARDQADRLKDWASEFLRDVGAGLALLDVSIDSLTPDAREGFFDTLGAGRYLEKFDGDRERAFAWAHHEARREIVGSLIERVVVRWDENHERVIEPQAVIELPLSTQDILTSGDQSLEYVERARQAALGD